MDYGRNRRILDVPAGPSQSHAKVGLLAVHIERLVEASNVMERVPANGERSS